MKTAHMLENELTRPEAHAAPNVLAYCIPSFMTIGNIFSASRAVSGMLTEAVIPPSSRLLLVAPVPSGPGRSRLSTDPKVIQKMLHISICRAHDRLQESQHAGENGNRQAGAIPAGRA